MVVALSLLLAALGFVLYRDRDFWFPETTDASNQPLEVTPTATSTAASQAAEPVRSPSTTKKARTRVKTTRNSAPTNDAPLPPTTITRTVLPPLEVEVVAGSTHRTVRPGTNSVQVELQAGSPLQKDSERSAPGENETAASVTTSAAERNQVSTEAAGVVTRSVQPSYPLLARQMKVQGSVILQALISSDGMIQDLHVLSGPPILASAAQEAVKQWHFKPHFEGAQAVETEAKITVNFTISTN
ncbi:MAG TPA: TonB family protein [Candidatus Dormibacteraeota bacterium]|nr:TonB family protein [Candidatus Dormibacteraeota bacterium]